MKATKKEINEYKKNAEIKYGMKVNYLSPNLTKEDLKWMKKSDKKHFRKRVVKSFFKSSWDLFPLSWMINLLAKIFIVSAVISYLDSQGSLTIFINIILILWILMPFKGLVMDLYYNLKFAFQKDEVKKK